MNCKRSGRDMREMRRGGVAGSEDNRWGYNLLDILQWEIYSITTGLSETK